MEREMNKKRERDQVVEEEDQQGGKNKKQELICFDHDHDFFTITDSTFRPLGVFDFPWLKENRVSESDDWKFDDDEFSYNLLVDNTARPDGLVFPVGEVPVLCQGTHIDELVDEFTTGDKLEEKPWISNVDETDGVDCIWSCVLNQPLALGPDRKSTR